MDRDYNLRRAFTKAQQGAYREASGFLKKILEFKPDDVESQALLADVYWRMGEKDEARSLADSLIKNHPDHPEAVFSHGDFLRYEEKFEEAEAYYRRALEMFPEHHLEAHSDLYVNLGSVLWEQRKRGEALKAWETALKLNPENKMAQENLDQFTNDYGQPKALTPTHDDVFAFMSVQQRDWPSDPSADLKHFNRYAQLVTLLWNLIPAKESLDDLSADEKQFFYASLKIDYASQSPHLFPWQTLSRLAKFGEGHYFHEYANEPLEYHLEGLFDPGIEFPGEEIEILLKKPDSVPLILNRLKKERNDDDPYWPLVCLAAHKTSGAAPVFFKYLTEHPDYHVADVALWGLSQLHQPGVREKLLEIAETHPDFSVRVMAYGALSGHSDEKVAQRLLERLKTEKEALAALFISLGAQPRGVVLKPLEEFYESYQGDDLNDLAETLVELYRAEGPHFPLDPNWRIQFYPLEGCEFRQAPSVFRICQICLEAKSSGKIKVKQKRSPKQTLEALQKESRLETRETCDCCQVPVFNYWGLPTCQKALPDARMALRHIVQSWIQEEHMTLYEVASEIEVQTAELARAKKPTKKDKLQLEDLGIQRAICQAGLGKGVFFLSDFIEKAEKENNDFT